jgi:chemotaxis protein MotB
MTPFAPRDSRAAGMAWLVTFSDLVVLMLAFFVLLFSMTVFQQNAFERLSESLAGTFGAEQPTVSSAPDGGPPGVEGLTRPRGQDLGYLAAIVRAAVAADSRLEGARVQWLDQRLVILLPSDLLFESGQAALAPTARPALAELGGLLANLRNAVAVAGHADPDEVPSEDSGADGDAWALSLARAMAVAGALRRAGYAAPMQTWAHADTRADMLAALPEAERARLRRRVDVVILPQRVAEDRP